MAKLNQILMGLALLLCAAPLAAQSCYIQLDDATGVPLPPSQLSELETAACELRDAFPVEFQNDFAVYDFGFYLHQEGFAGGVPEVFQAKVAEVSSQSGAYLLFGHEVGRDGGSVRLWTSFSFDSEDYECLDAASLDVAIRGMVGGQGDRNEAHIKKLEAMRALESELTEGFCCSAYYATEEGGRGGQPVARASDGESVCVDNAKVDAAFQELLNDPVYVLILYKIATIAAFYQNCANQEWKPGAENGIIPKCIWENATVPVGSLYSGQDLPFYSGATDGLYSEAKGVADFLLSLDDFAGGVASVIQSYTMWYLVCEKGQSSKLNKLEYNLLMEELKNAEPQWQPSLFSDFSLGYYLSKASAAVVAYFDVEEYCKGLENTRNTVETIYDAISQKDTWVGIYKGIIEQALTIAGNIDGVSNEERYYQGYYGTKVAINFLPGLALTKSKYLNGLSNFLDNLSARVSNNSSSYGFKLKKALFDSRKARLKAEAPMKNWPKSKQDQFFNDFPDYDKLKTVDNEGVVRAWGELSDLTGSKAWVRTQVPILERMAGLTISQQRRVKNLYANLQLPSNRPPPGIPPFSVTKNINGLGNVTIQYDVYGFPKFDEFMKNRKILNNNGESVVPSYPGPLAGTGNGDLGNATNWALTHFPSNKVRRTPSNPGQAPKNTIDILDGSGNWITHTWHHHQNGRDLFAVPSSVHNSSAGGFAHSGGNSLIGGADEVIGAFPGPVFD